MRRAAKTGTAVWRVSLGAPVPDNTFGCGNFEPDRRDQHADDRLRDAHPLRRRRDPRPGPAPAPRLRALARRRQGAQGLAGRHGDAGDLHRRHHLRPDGARRARRAPRRRRHRSTCPTAAAPATAAATTAGSRRSRPSIRSTRTSGRPPRRGGGSWAVSGPSYDGKRVFLTTGNTFGASTWQGGEAIVAFSNPSLDVQRPELLRAGELAGPRQRRRRPRRHRGRPRRPPGQLDEARRRPRQGRQDLPRRSRPPRRHRRRARHRPGRERRDHQRRRGLLDEERDVRRLPGQRLVVPERQRRPRRDEDHRDDRRRPPGARSRTAPARRWSPQAGDQVVVWGVGAEGDSRLHGFDGDTGAPVFTGGGAGDQMGSLNHLITPIAAKGKIYVGGSGAVYAFSL